MSSLHRFLNVTFIAQHFHHMYIVTIATFSIVTAVDMVTLITGLVAMGTVAKCAVPVCRQVAIVVIIVMITSATVTDEISAEYMTFSCQRGLFG